jgi:DTW domain-containing protein YfiP
MKLRPYTDRELAAIRKNYAMGCVIDNRRLAEAGAPYYYGDAGDRRCRKCGDHWTECACSARQSRRRRAD